MSKFSKLKNKRLTAAIPLEQPDTQLLFDRVGDLLAKQKPAEALDLLANVDERTQRQPEYLYLYGTVQALLGNSIAAIAALETCIERFPSMLPAYFNLIFAYAAMHYWASTARLAEKYLKKTQIPLENLKQIRQIYQEASRINQESAAALNVPADRFRQAAVLNEKIETLVSLGEYRQAAREAGPVTRIIPHWPSPYNNRTLALFYCGKLDAALRDGQHVLEKIDAENIHALGNLILIHTSQWQFEQAAVYQARLVEVLKHVPLERVDLNKVAESLAICEDDLALWNLAERLLKMPARSVSTRTWYILGAAAANSGHLAEAKSLLEWAIQKDPNGDPHLESILQMVRQAQRKGRPAAAPGLTGRFPYLTFLQFWPQALAREVFDFGSDEAYDDNDLRAFLKDYLTRYPFVAYAGKLLLWYSEDEEQRRMGIDLLLASQYEGAHQEGWRFATSAYGADQERYRALGRLQACGLLPTNQPMRFWMAKQGRWDEVRISQNEVIESYLPPCDPQALSFAERAAKIVNESRGDSKMYAEAEKYLEKALKIDPNCVIALHNLGTVHSLQGRVEESERYFRRAVEIDPQYLFGYTSLAELELGRGNQDACERYLEKVFQSPQIPANAMRRALYIQVRLRLLKRQFDIAKTALTTLIKIAPDFPEIDRLRQTMLIAEAAHSLGKHQVATIHGNHDRMRAKPFGGETLAACLERHNRDSLTVFQRFWGLRSGGRKADVIRQLVEIMQDGPAVQGRLAPVLNPTERQALAWLLEAGGKRPLAELIQKYGDDYDESPYWTWNNPKSVLGRLQSLGIVSVGALDGAPTALIPVELRPVLAALFEE